MRDGRPTNRNVEGDDVEPLAIYLIFSENENTGQIDSYASFLTCLYLWQVFLNVYVVELLVIQVKQFYLTLMVKFHLS